MRLACSLECQGSANCTPLLPAVEKCSAEVKKNHLDKPKHSVIKSTTPSIESLNKLTNSVSSNQSKDPQGKVNINVIVANDLSCQLSLDHLQTKHEPSLLCPAIDSHSWKQCPSKPSDAATRAAETSPACSSSIPHSFHHLFLLSSSRNPCPARPACPNREDSQHL